MPDSNIISTFLTLSLTVVAFWVLFILLKKYGIKLNPAANLIPLQVVSKLSLLPKSHIYVVQVSDKTLVLGVTDNNINILSELDTQNTALSEALAKQNKEIKPLPPNLVEFFSQFNKKHKTTENK